MHSNILLVISYDGSGFSGWQLQPGRRTVCGELTDVLTRIFGESIKLNACSRTDAGVHAKGLCASFQADLKMPVGRLPKVMNDMLTRDRMLGVPEIKILSASLMPDDFHARFSAKGKRYIYRIRTACETDIFIRNYCWQLGKKPDVQLMRKAAEYIVGEHDFACFQSAGSPRENTVRTVFSLNIEEITDEIIISIEGSGFLYNMVRIIVGTLVETGLGKRTPDSMKDVIESCDRRKAGPVAPAQGLYLDEVFYA